MNTKTTQDSKTCAKCNQHLARSSFYRLKTGRLNSYCKDCWGKTNRVQSLRYYHRTMADPVKRAKKTETRRNGVRRRLYDISPEEYQRMFDAQAGVCAICRLAESARVPKTGQIKTLAVDHDSDTGQIRALLCGRCNTGIGNLKHSPERLRKAAEYLESFGRKL